jgi:hypothetical protein
MLNLTNKSKIKFKTNHVKTGVIHLERIPVIYISREKRKNKESFAASRTATKTFPKE